MPHMIPYYYEGEAYEVTLDDGESYVLPADIGDAESLMTDFPRWRTIERLNGFFAHLTAPGYLDQTEWAGPFKTHDDAASYIRDMYDVDPETGEDLADGDA